jgi:hypothetical protein
LSLYEVSFVVFPSSCMYWLCMAEGIAKSHLQIPGGFFFNCRFHLL